MPSPVNSFTGLNSNRPHHSGEFWAAYLAQAGHRDGPHSTWYFADNPQDADELLALVVEGNKRATAALAWAYAYDNEPLPEPGDRHVVTSFSGEPGCVIRTTAVEVVPYDSVSPEFAAAEGEGDLSLAYWREVHWPYFVRECERVEREPTQAMPVVCHRFELVFHNRS